MNPRSHLLFIVAFLMYACSNDDDNGEIPQAPTPPSDLLATDVTHKSLTLRWSDNDENEEGFAIERKKGADPVFIEIARLEADVEQYADEDLAAESNYQYRVYAYNEAGESEYSEVLDVETLPASLEDLFAPSGLTAQAESGSEIQLAWEDNSDNETGFELEVAIGDLEPARFELVMEVPADTTTLRHTGLSANTNYSYRIRAVNDEGFSDYSALASTSTNNSASAPVAPSGLVAQPLNDQEIRLTWRDNSNDETGFELEAALSGVGTPDFELITTLGENETTFTHSGLSPLTGYVYRARAINDDGFSAYTDLARATTNAAPVVPVAPSGLTAEALSIAQVRLAWVDNAGNESGFRVEAYADDGGGPNFTVIAELGPNINTFDHTGLSPGVEYVYRVKAYNDIGESEPSNTASATTPSAPRGPLNLSAKATSPSSVSLTWTDNASNEDGFYIERRLNRSNFRRIATVNANVRSYSDPDVATGSTYIYRVQAFNAIGNSPYSNEAPITLLPTEITSFATEDNVLIFNSAVSSSANTVYNSSSNECGCNFSVLPFNTEFVCGFVALKFGQLQSQISGRTVRRAVLRLHVRSLPANLTTYAVNAFSGNWSTNTITYNNAPGYWLQRQVNTTSPSTSVIPYEIDITAIVRNWANGTWSNYGVILREIVPATLPPVSLLNVSGFDSIEVNAGSDRIPQIIVEFE